MPWFTIREASAVMKISSRTVQRMIKSGTLQSRLDEKKGLRFVFIADGNSKATETKQESCNPHSFEPLFEIFEGLAILKDHCREHLDALSFHKWLGGILPNNSIRPDTEEWHHLFLKITYCYDNISKQVCDMRTDISSLQKIYNIIVDIKIKWLRYTRQNDDDNAKYDDIKTTNDPDQVDIDLLSIVITKLKKLIIDYNTAILNDKGCDKPPDKS